MPGPWAMARLGTVSYAPYLWHPPLTVRLRPPLAAAPAGAG
jgi:peptidoglycan/LPS O-acetylase OafA/YrhL